MCATLFRFVCVVGMSNSASRMRAMRERDAAAMAMGCPKAEAKAKRNVKAQNNRNALRGVGASAVALDSVTPEISWLKTWWGANRRSIDKKVIHTQTPAVPCSIFDLPKVDMKARDIYFKSDRGKWVPQIQYKQSEIPGAGYGVFALRPFQADEHVTLFVGPTTRDVAKQRRLQKDPLFGPYMVELPGKVSYLCLCLQSTQTFWHVRVRVFCFFWCMLCF